MNKKYQLISETISLQEDLRSATKTTISVAGITLFVVASIPSMGFAMIPWAAYKMIRAAFNDGQRRCRVFGINTKSRQTCLLKVKLEQLSIARKYVSDEKTKRKIEAKMVKIQNRIDKYTADLARKGKTPMEPLD